MNGQEPEKQVAARKVKALSGPGAVIFVLAALAMIAVAWFLVMRKPSQQAGLGAECLVLFIGANALVTAVIAYLRDMDLADALDMLINPFLGVLALIGAILKAIWDTILGFLGWD